MEERITGQKQMAREIRIKGLSLYLIHLVNRASGIPNQPDNGAIDEIPRVGPVIITVKTAKPPVSVTAAWEGVKPRWKHKGQTLTITLDAVHIHEAIAIRRA
jgi:hypothetical protein